MLCGSPGFVLTWFRVESKRKTCWKGDILLIVKPTVGQWVWVWREGDCGSPSPSLRRRGNPAYTMPGTERSGLVNSEQRSDQREGAWRRGETPPSLSRRANRVALLKVESDADQASSRMRG